MAVQVLGLAVHAEVDVAREVVGEEADRVHQARAWGRPAAAAAASALGRASSRRPPHSPARAPRRGRGRTRSVSSRGSSSGLWQVAVRTSSPKSESTEPSITVSRSITQSASPVRRRAAGCSACSRGASPGAGACSGRACASSRVSSASAARVASISARTPAARPQASLATAASKSAKRRARSWKPGIVTASAGGGRSASRPANSAKARATCDAPPPAPAIVSRVTVPSISRKVRQTLPSGAVQSGRAVAGGDERQHAPLEIAHAAAREGGAQVRRHAREVVHHAGPDRGKTRVLMRWWT